MIRTIFALALSLVTTSLFSQFNPDIARKSLVRVQVDGGGHTGICSGFLWKDPSHIVTALHAMKPNGTILIFYPGGVQREAEVSKVFVAGDLVLLKTTSPPPTSADLVAVSGFQSKVAVGEKLSAIGYYGGAPSITTQSMDKGYAYPETVQGIAPLALQATIKSIQFPSIQFAIYYLSGSLLPGYSGCPIYNQKNELVCVGDGGLDQGQTNISWCIPAANLIELEKSTENLPPGLGATKIHFTSDVTPIPIVKDSTPTTTGTTEVQSPEGYTSFALGDFDFFLTKRRSWEQMRATSADPANMQSVSDEFKEGGLRVEYDSLWFDVYDDINNGFTIAIPKGAKLDAEGSGKLLVDMKSLPEGWYFQLNYGRLEHSNNAVQQVFESIYNTWKSRIHGLTTADGFSRTVALNDEWTVDYRLYNSDSSYVNGEGEEINELFYLSVVHTAKEAFYSLATCHIPSDRKDLNDAITSGIDCIYFSEQNQGACDYFQSLMQVIAAAHLSTRSFRD